jgi:thiol-disulfide isomerase/thioredoxin
MQNSINFFRLSRKARNVLGAVLVLILTLLALTACQKQADAYDSQGQAIRLSDYQGKWVLVNFWASWCSPCLQELPELNKLQQKYPDNIQVLGVNFDQMSNQEIQAFGQKYALNFPLLSHFPLIKIGDKGVSVLPTTFVINPAGELVATLTGPQTEKSLMEQVLPGKIQGKRDG